MNDPHDPDHWLNGGQPEFNFDKPEPEEDKRLTLMEKFTRYHEANPHVAVKLTEMAFTASRAGARNISIAMLFEVLRWRTNIETVRTESAFKISDPLAAPYARFIMRENPALAGIFKLKKSEVDKHFNTDIKGNI